MTMDGKVVLYAYFYSFIYFKAEVEFTDFLPSKKQFYL